MVVKYMDGRPEKRYREEVHARKTNTSLGHINRTEVDVSPTQVPRRCLTFRCMFPCTPAPGPRRAGAPSSVVRPAVARPAAVVAVVRALPPVRPLDGGRVPAAAAGRTQHGRPGPDPQPPFRRWRPGGRRPGESSVRVSSALRPGPAGAGLSGQLPGRHGLRAARGLAAGRAGGGGRRGLCRFRCRRWQPQCGGEPWPAGCASLPRGDRQQQQQQ